MVNKIWGIFIIVGIIFGFLNGTINEINTVILESGKMCLELIIQIFPLLAMWMGITEIAEKSGLLNILSKKIGFILKPLFPDIPKGHKSLSYIASNIIANVFGLGSAATPFGLKAMESLQELNNNKKVASRSMITFTTINTSGLTIIPVTVIAIRTMYNSLNPTIIVFASIMATFLSTLSGILIDRFLSRR